MNGESAERLRSLLTGSQLNRRRLVTVGLGLAGSMSAGSLLAACQARDADDDDPVEETEDEPVGDDGDDVEVEDSDDEDIEAAEPDDGTDPGVREVEIDGEAVEISSDFEPFDAQELNLETLEVEFPDGPVQAQPWENTWVGQVTDDLFIGIRVADAYGDEPRDVTAYLCDNDLWVLLDGELVDGAGTLSDEDTEVELELVDEQITGTVTLAREDPVDFTASPADGDAGVYIAATEINEVEVTGRWIVLEDGQQRGTEICCTGGCCPPIVVCWPCREQL